MKKLYGLTLVELMATLAVFAIVAAIAVPNVNEMMKSNRRVAYFNDLVGGISVARDEAVKRGRIVTVCGQAGGPCDTASWENGWVMFVDENADGNFNAGIDTMLQQHPAMPAGFSMQPQGFDNNVALQFRPDGSLRDTSGDGFNSGTIVLCFTRDGGVDAERAKALQINVMGRPTRSVDTDSDRIVEDITGANVACP
jgi:type IV fimbrial biogenesis protein FimT